MPKPVTLKVLAPHPSPAHGLDDGERAAAARRLDCRAYDGCLALADERGWRGFHCRACVAYVAQTPRQRYRDMLAMLQLLADGQVVARLTAATTTATTTTTSASARAPQRLFLPDADDTAPLAIVRKPCA